MSLSLSSLLKNSSYSGSNLINVLLRLLIIKTQVACSAFCSGPKLLSTSKRFSETPLPSEKTPEIKALPRGLNMLEIEKFRS